MLVVIARDWVGGCCGGCREFGGEMLEGRIRAGAISSMSSSGGSESEAEESESSSIRAWWAILEVVSGEMFCGGVGEVEQGWAWRIFDRCLSHTTSRF